MARTVRAVRSHAAALVAIVTGSDLAPAPASFVRAQKSLASL